MVIWILLNVIKIRMNLFFGIIEKNSRIDLFLFTVEKAVKERMIDMARKGENIYKRKDGRWEGRYKKGRKENGQIKYGYLYGRTYTEVKNSLYVYKLKYQTLIHLNGESGFPYEDWVVQWLTEQRHTLKQSTYSTYCYKMKKYVLPIIGHIPLNQITNETIQTLITTWQENQLQPGTIHVLFQIIKKTFTEAYRVGRLLQRPCESIRLPKKKKPKPVSLSKKDQENLEKKAKSVAPHQGLPVLLALNAGLRIGEIAALRWQDIDLERKIIRVTQTFQRLTLSVTGKKTHLFFDESKTESSNRIIPMSHSLYKYLKKWKRKSPGIFVCSNKGRPSEPRLLTYYFHKIRRACQLENVHFHQLRHTFATRCIETNADIASVSRLLGHSSTQTTLDVYTDSLLVSRKQAILQMESVK